MIGKVVFISIFITVAATLVVWDHWPIFPPPDGVEIELEPDGPEAKCLDFITAVGLLCGHDAACWESKDPAQQKDCIKMLIKKSDEKPPIHKRTKV